LEYAFFKSQPVCFFHEKLHFFIPVNHFVRLFLRLDQSSATREKLEALVEFFKTAGEKDKIYALAYFTGRAGKRHVAAGVLRSWAAEWAGISDWLFEEAYHVVGDLAETIASLKAPGFQSQADTSLSDWAEVLQSLSLLTLVQKKERVTEIWNELSKEEILVFNKLITGGFRIGVSDQMVVKGIAMALDCDPVLVQHRIMGQWKPEERLFSDLFSEDDGAADDSRPYPFFLAHSLEESFFSENPEHWQAEWKWDGIRCQIIRRNGQIWLWSRGEDLISDKFPELQHAAHSLEDGTALDGELVLKKGDDILPFSLLQTRITRKKISKKLLEDAPAHFIAYDLLELKGQDVRANTLYDRRKILETMQEGWTGLPLSLSSKVDFQTWEDLREKRTESRDRMAEGLMLKRLSSPYKAGRKKGDWWKWKLDPMQIDGVLMYARKGHGGRADLFTDYTLAVWDGDRLVPFAAAYSGLSDEEMRAVDAFVKKNTREKFGPVRTVEPVLVFEIGFEGIQHSARHKSGIALRFPRILRWRKDKKAEEADTLNTLKGFLRNSGKDTA
jgi:DNA ligase-1